MQNAIGSYVFHERHHLDAALSHPSAGISLNSGFQRLEFMGDSVLSLVITDALMRAFPTESEGGLSKRRAVLVSRDTCNKVGTTLGLHHRIKVGSNVDMVNSSIVADAVEAVIGAIYIDSNNDINICKKWILELWEPFLAHSHQGKEPPMDPKTKLQEWTQSHKMPAPIYNEIGRKGPDHALTISVSVEIPGLIWLPSHGEGRTKKAAEKQAAAQLLEMVSSS